MSSVAMKPVYAIVGADRFLRRTALEDVLRSIDAGADARAATKVDGDSADVAAVLDDLRTPSLLGERAVVVVDDADEFISEHRAVLEKYCAAPSLDGCLVLLCDSMPANTRLYKAIEKTGQVVKCEALKGWPLQAWIVRRANEVYAKSVSNDAAKALRELVGDSPGWLDTELSKLAAFVGARKEITAADVQAATGQSREEKVFGVLDAVAAGDAPAALRMWQQVWATDRAAPGRAIAGLAWAVRRFLKLRRACDAGANLAATAKSLGVFTDPNVLRRQLDMMPAARIEALQRALLEADVDCKTSGSTVEVAVEKIIVRFAVQSNVPKAKAG